MPYAHMPAFTSSLIAISLSKMTRHANSSFQLPTARREQITAQITTVWHQQAPTGALLQSPEYDVRY
jgi:hypothetical protein